MRFFLNPGIYLRCALGMAFFFGQALQAQQTGYFQQEVNYKISARLNDQANTVRAQEEIVYVNNSPQKLDTIWFHLWPNAYKDNSTALDKQLVGMEEFDLHFAKPEERGFLDSLDFKVNGRQVKWQYHPQHIDICYLLLNEPLQSKDSVLISTPFFLKIPDAKFSRLGHSGQAYFMTQWYPKPAVFDNKGWHAMPYLTQGEFYSEYGSFDVSITLPKNYMLAATGDRIDAGDENQLLEEKIAETKKHLENNTSFEFKMDFPPSSPDFKTVRFKQYRVHDFAWFADKRFYVLKDQVELPESKRLVDTWVFFTERNKQWWKKATDYVNDAIRFYSKMVGDYPYNHATAIDGTIVAGGGMEYPNITVIGDAGSDFMLDMVITHEVGHNWFYGILGSNEREHPFQDEGINSLYELLYIKGKYGWEKLSRFIGKDSTFKLMGTNRLPVSKYHELSYRGSMQSNRDQAMNLHSTEYTSSNYGGIVYSKTAVSFEYLRQQLGEENFDKAMHTYFEEFKFKHPQPDDLFNTLSRSTGADLDWFKKNFYETKKHFDLRIKKVKRDADGNWRITVKDKTKSGIPFQVHAYKDGKLLGEVWSISPGKIREAGFPPVNADRFVVDGAHLIAETNERNNFKKTAGLFKRSRPLKLSFLSTVGQPDKAQLSYMPVLGGNIYNGFMLGMAFHNYNLFEKRFEWLIAPMYGFKSKSPAGYAEMNLNFFPATIFRQITLGAKFKTFGYDTYPVEWNLVTSEIKRACLNYYRLSPYLQFDVKKKKALQGASTFLLQSHLVFSEKFGGFERVGDNFVSDKQVSANLINQATYLFSKRNVLNPYSLNVSAQQIGDVSKVYGHLNYRWRLGKRSNIEIRAFAGAFLSGGRGERNPYAFRASGYSGWHDYLYEGNFAARNEMNTMGYTQFMERDGAMKIWTPNGQTTEWLASINIRSPRLGKIPLRLFADVVSCDGRSLLNDQFLWDAGVNLVIINDYVEVYIPLLYNKGIRSELKHYLAWYERFRFTFNIHKLDPKTVLHSSLF